MSDRSLSGAVCAVVVAYHPDEGFAARLALIRPQVTRLVVIDNTPGDAGWDPADPGIVLIRNHANVGIAAALNQGLADAARHACKWVLALDQDTLCRTDMVDTLLAVAVACQPTPAVVGGNYFDHQNHRFFLPQADAAAAALPYREATTVITSGSLVDVDFALGIGGFREDYFIDQVDHEFCLRARRHGGRVLISHRCVMDHSVGTAGGAHLPFLGTLPNHPPVRKYYITRNTLVTVATYWRQEPAWCLRRMTRLLLGLFSMALLESQARTKVRAFGAGFADGLRHRMGPAQRQWLR